MRTIKRILIPTDFSDCANEAIKQGLALARRFGASVTLLHVYQLPVATLSEATLLYTDEIIKAVEAGAKPELDRAKADAERTAEGTVAISTNLLMGIPYLEIVEQAQVGEYDLIVMGTHGRTGIKHLLMGSVAERVVQLARCPVLTLRDSKALEHLRAAVAPPARVIGG